MWTRPDSYRLCYGRIEYPIRWISGRAGCTTGHTGRQWSPNICRNRGMKGVDSMKVGLLVGREDTFPQAFIERVNGTASGVTAEFIKLGGTRLDEDIPYRVIVDRM